MATKVNSLRAEVEAEMQAEAREAQKDAIKACLRRIVTLEQSSASDAERLKADIAKIEKEIEDIESGKVATRTTTGNFKNSTRVAEPIPGYTQYYGSLISVGDLYKKYTDHHAKSSISDQSFRRWAENQGYWVS